MKLLIPIFLVAITTPLSRSCKKETVSETKSNRSTIELLSQNTWKAEEVRVQFNNNNTTYYKRGSSGTTYDSDMLQFNADGSGTYYYGGAAYSTTWNFTDDAETKMKIIIDQPPVPIIVYLENINITESHFRYAQYSTSGTVSYLASCTRTPIESSPEFTFRLQ